VRCFRLTLILESGLDHNCGHNVVRTVPAVQRLFNQCVFLGVWVKKTFVLWAVVIGIFLGWMIPAISSGQSDVLQEGIEQYKLENYEEAVDKLLQARKQEPTSSVAAFFLGLAYKQMMDYPNAALHLKDAVTNPPRIKDALVELIEVLYRMPGTEHLEEAGKWIGVAEEEGIYPPKIAFLKGLVLQKQGKYDEAIAQFQQARSLDKTFEQAAEFQVAMCYMKTHELKKARDRFQAAVQLNPQADLADFARQYQDLVAKRIELEKPVRVTVGVLGQYDSNLVLKPFESAVAPDITDEAARAVLATLRVDYVPMLKGPWLFNAQYSASGSFHDNHSTSHDIIANGLYLAPGYNFGRYALNLAVNYNHFLKRDPGYEGYLNYVSAGPLFRVLINKSQLLELFGSYDYKKYDTDPLRPEDDRDSDTIRMYASWIKSFENSAFLNLKYEYSTENAEGENWSNEGHKFSLNSAIPLRKRLILQLSGQVFIQNYENAAWWYDPVAAGWYEETREDKLYQGTIGLTWEIARGTNLIAQYTRSRSDSNISIYDYKRDQYTAGIEYRF